MHDIYKALRALNPVHVGAPAQRERLETILATQGPVTPRPRPRPQMRWAIAAVAAATAAAVVYTVVDPFGTATQPALALTPPPLAYHPDSQPASRVLEAIADRVEKLPDERPSPWKTEHFVWDSWSLSTRIDGVQVTSAVIPEHRETWQKPDESTRWKARTLAPVFQNETQRDAWEETGAVGRTPQQFTGSSGPTSQRSATEPPTTVDGMREWLADGRTRLTAGLLYEVVPERAQEHVFSPGQRAALLRVLAEAQGVEYEGAVTDRADRAGEAFSLSEQSGGLPSKRTLIFDPQTGTLLADEEQILDDPGALNVKPNSVTGYMTFLTAERLS
ncbi:CU044_5270 family protein [Streptomyces sp. NPDC008313]|uniref:CU044_5270 family protein n=1 Tax=Streptomyces sp. NPDC008313 TaxID=3364826 RepID=UPI0036E534C2